MELFEEFGNRMLSLSFTDKMTSNRIWHRSALHCTASTQWITKIMWLHSTQLFSIVCILHTTDHLDGIPQQRHYHTDDENFKTLSSWTNEFREKERKTDTQTTNAFWINCEMLTFSIRYLNRFTFLRAIKPKTQTSDGWRNSISLIVRTEQLTTFNSNEATNLLQLLEDTHFFDIALMMGEIDSKLAWNWDVSKLCALIFV